MGVHDRERRFNMCQILVLKDDNALIKTAFSDESYFTLGELIFVLQKLENNVVLCFVGCRRT